MNSNLHKNHKRWTKAKWKYRGLLWMSEEEFEEIYQLYILSTHCELCNNPYKSNRDRQMDHIHYIDNKFGWFRNVVCTRCNIMKSDNKLHSNNTSGYKGISKIFRDDCKQGFLWQFGAMVDSKYKTIKSSADYDKLVKFADQWKLDNNYNT
tara:strand:- start:157 stop:609 length:453 start_codon:yes stop_codon:yes gene_type:complete